MKTEKPLDESRISNIRLWLAARASPAHCPKGTPASALYADHRHWCLSKGDNAPSISIFGKALRQIGLCRVKSSTIHWMFELLPREDGPIDTRSQAR